MLTGWGNTVAALAAAYILGWRRAALPGGSAWRLWAFLLGLVAMWAALASPIASWDQEHLTGHMIQHLLLMTVAAPLLLVGEPMRVLQQCLQAGASALCWRSLHPMLCWFIGTFTVLVWHIPSIFAFGMRWHGFQHATFLAAGLLFWIPVIRPWPTVAPWPSWSIPLYLFLATLPCDGLSAFLVFCGRNLYPQYCGVQAHCDMAASALEDQQRAGALMWFWVTFAYLVPAVVVTMRLLSAPKARAMALRGSAAG